MSAAKWAHKVRIVRAHAETKEVGGRSLTAEQADPRKSRVKPIRPTPVGQPGSTGAPQKGVPRAGRVPMPPVGAVPGPAPGRRQPTTPTATQKARRGIARWWADTEWRGIRRRTPSAPTVEVVAGVDSPLDLYTVRTCHLCRKATWVRKDREDAERIACPECVERLTRPPPPPAQPRLPEPELGDEATQKKRGEALARFLREEVAEGWRFLEKFETKDEARERERRILEWNETHERNVTDDVNETLMLDMRRLPEERDAQYVARLEARQTAWRRGRIVTATTAVHASRPVVESPGSPPTARKGARRTG